MNLLEQYQAVRENTELICLPLEIEDYVVQPIADVSPPKWHLGHTTWFFETFVLKEYLQGYEEFDPQYNFVFNSYYETIGSRVIRTDRGNLSRPSVKQVFHYRAYVDSQMEILLSQKVVDESILAVITLGLNHEQQHQELLLTDIKYILGHNPLFPAYSISDRFDRPAIVNAQYINIPEGLYEIGYGGNAFHFDNECNRHKVYLQQYTIATALVSNRDYLEFIQSGGYQDFRFWHAEGWDWVKQNHVIAPLYWFYMDQKWMQYTFKGLQELHLDEAVCHVSFYEAAAFAAWKDARLPTEAEWEAAAAQLDWGQRWEWTDSAYLPYPGFSKAAGAIGEYNGKFMINQMVLRGGSVVTAEGHSRNTYRNFFHPDKQWQYSGIRLVI